MPRPQPNLSERARGILLGVACGNPHPGEWPDPAGRAVILAEELAQDPIDLARVAARWVEWSREADTQIGPATMAGLDHLARWQAPPRDLSDRAESAGLAAALPVAIAGTQRTRSLVSGSYHVALLTHPDPVAAWCTVAVTVAARQLLLGFRDVLPDVVEVLRANDASETVLSSLLRIPFLPSEDLQLDLGAEPLACMEAALWVVARLGTAPAVFRWLEGRELNPWLVSLVYGLVGAREGEQALPVARLTLVHEPTRIRAVAKRLIHPPEAGS